MRTLVSPDARLLFSLYHVHEEGELTLTVLGCITQKWTTGQYGGISFTYLTITIVSLIITTLSVGWRFIYLLQVS